MSRLIATWAHEMLSGTNTNVMGQFEESDESAPGTVVLASPTNMMPNPDLTQVNERERLRFWDLDAPPSPDSWNVYMRQLTRINNAGAHELIKNGPPMLRQNLAPIRWSEHTYEQDAPLLTDKSLPDLSRDEPTDLAPVLDKPRFKKDAAPGKGGYPARSANTMYASYFGILGDNPMGSKRITNAAPAVAIPSAIAQGQSLRYLLPDEVPDGWTGVGFCAGPDETQMWDQKRVDVRGRVVTEALHNGPYRRGGPVVTPTSENKTSMGAYESLPKPRHRRDHSSQGLDAGTYPVAYQLMFEEGWTASSATENIVVDNDQKGECIEWAPGSSAARKPGVKRWRPIFKAANDAWHTFEDAQANGYPMSKWARLHTRSTGEDWNSDNGPVPLPGGRPEADSSGVPGPVDPMEPPVPQGAVAMKPGRYALRLTAGSEKENMESRPSPRVIVTLRDAGLAGGGAASGVTDETIRIFRPPGQMIKNSRLVEVDPQDGTTELHWERPVGVTEVTVGDGVLSVASSTGSGVKIYRRSSMEPIEVSRYYTVRYRMAVGSIGAASSVSVKLRFLSSDVIADQPGSILGTMVTENFTTVDDQYIKTTFGPPNGSAHFDMPVGTKFVQAEVTGQSATARTFSFSLSNLGIWVGKASPRKLWALELADDTPGRDVWPVPDDENSRPDIRYPAGAYIRTVTNPVNPAKHRTYNLLGVQGFETGSLTANGWTNPAPTGGATITAASILAISGAYGARMDVAASSGAFGAFIWKDFLSAGRTQFGVETLFRVRALPSSGSVGLLGVTRAQDTTSFLAYADIMSTGAIRLQYWNGTAIASLTVSGVTAQMGDDLRIDLSFSGVKTAGSNGSVTLRVKRNDRPPVVATASSQPWSAVDAHRVMAGFFAGSGAGITARVLMDVVRVASTSISETSDVPGSMVEYWAPQGQPGGDPDHFMTGIRFPVKPSTTYVDSCYIAHDGITTPQGGADLFRIVSRDADGRVAQDHGYILEGAAGKRHWDRHYRSYTTPADAAYVEYTRNRVGDGLIWAMAFQHELGTTPTPFVNTNATSGSFSVVLKNTLTGGPKADDVTFTKALLRMHAVVTHVRDAAGAIMAGSVVTLRIRGADSVAGLAAAPWKTSLSNINRYHSHFEVEVTLGAPTNKTSPEVRAVFIDVERDRPVLTQQDGRDFHGGIIAYGLTPASPTPNVVRKEYADGSVGLENVGRGRVPEKLKFSLQAHTEAGKRMAEILPATDQPLFGVEAHGKRYRVAMVPEFNGSVEEEPDGVKYWDYTTESIVADVISTDDL